MIPKKLLQLVLFFSISLFCLVSLVSFLLIYLFAFSQNLNKTTSSYPVMYHYFETSPTKNETTDGIIKLKNLKLQKEEFISYRNRRTGNTVIISNFAVGEEKSNYKCHGSCFCSDPQRRNIALPSTLTRSLFLIFSAFSANMAFKIAQKSFHEECSHQFSDTCDPDNIISEVSKCSTTEHETEPDEEIDLSDFEISVEEVEGENEEGDEEEEKEEEEGIRFFCWGYCLTNYKLFNVPTAMQAIQEYGECWDLKEAAYVVINKINNPRKLKVHYFAKLKFRRDILQPFCRDWSIRNHFVYAVPKTIDKGGNRIRKKKLKRRHKRTKHRDSLCGSTNSKNTLHNVKCFTHLKERFPDEEGTHFHD